MWLRINGPSARLAPSMLVGALYRSLYMDVRKLSPGQAPGSTFSPDEINRVLNTFRDGHAFADYTNIVEEGQERIPLQR